MNNSCATYATITHAPTRVLTYAYATPIGRTPIEQPTNADTLAPDVRRLACDLGCDLRQSVTAGK